MATQQEAAAAAEAEQLGAADAVVISNGAVDASPAGDADEALSEDVFEEEYEEEEEDWEADLLDALALVCPPGEFACSGVVSNLPAFTPAVTVEGVGRLALPLCAEQAATLRAASEPAPYGKGHDTVVDENVRRARQVPASRVSVAAP